MADTRQRLVCGDTDQGMGDAPACAGLRLYKI